MLVDLMLIGVDSAGLHFAKSYRPAGEVRLEEGIDRGDGAPPEYAIDFRRRAISNAPRQLGIFQSDQLAVGRGKVEVVSPGALAADRVDNSPPPTAPCCSAGPRR